MDKSDLRRAILKETLKNRMPDGDVARTIIMQRYFEGLSMSEISKASGMSEDHVVAFHLRAMKFLRSEISELNKMNHDALGHLYESMLSKMKRPRADVDAGVTIVSWLLPPDARNELVGDFLEVVEGLRQREMPSWRMRLCVQIAVLTWSIASIRVRFRHILSRSRQRL